jgi:hypothetical protein
LLTKITCEVRPAESLIVPDWLIPEGILSYFNTYYQSEGIVVMEQYPIDQSDGKFSESQKQQKAADCVCILCTHKQKKEKNDNLEFSPGAGALALR